MDSAILQGIQLSMGNPFFGAALPAFAHLGPLGAMWLAVGLGLVVSKKHRFCGFSLFAVAVASLPPLEPSS